MRGHRYGRQLVAWYAISGIPVGNLKFVSQRRVSIGGPHASADVARSTHPGRMILYAASRDEALRSACRAYGITLRTDGAPSTGVGA
jgi:hypothetical protein